MKRTCMKFLTDWIQSFDRKPLVIRGARQVGKTWIVRRLSEVLGRQLIEINLESEPTARSLFQSNDPKEIIKLLGEAYDKVIDCERALLFIDELQEAPEVFAKLRWFAEKMPQLAVIVAGSLLELVLKDKSIRMPVGRVSYMYLEPFSFEEFLGAYTRSGLLQAIKTFEWDKGIPQYTHEELTRIFNEYVIVGGMPAAVKKWIASQSLTEVARIHRDIFTTYRDDFDKYGSRISSELIDKTLMAIPKNLGRKFIYSEVDRSAQVAPIKKSLQLLCNARLCSKVTSTGASGIPLSHEENEKIIKVILLDVGLCTAATGLSLEHVVSTDDLTLINRGGIAEQVVGQMLRTLFGCTEDPRLYYWTRQAKKSHAEVDYVLQSSTSVVPIEVKAGKAGTLKSLHLFMAAKGFATAVRLYSGVPLKTAVTVKDNNGTPISYTLRSLPFYMLSEIHRLIK